MGLVNVVGFINQAPLIDLTVWPQLLALLLGVLFFQFRAVVVGEITLSLSIALYLPIILVIGIGEAMLVSCLASIIHSLATGKYWDKVFLNSMQRAFSALVAGQVFLLLGGEIGVLSLPKSFIPAILAGLTYNIVNLVSVLGISILMGKLDKTGLHRFIRAYILAFGSTLLFTYTGVLFSFFVAAWEIYGLVLFMVLMLGIAEMLLFGVKLNAEQQLRIEVEKELVLDSKTKVYNYRYLRKWLERSLSTQPVSVLFIDIDDFKIFNDQYGHEQGDLALKNVATVIVNNVRGVDRVVRFGGEEFVVLLPNMKGSQALEVAQRIQEKLATIPEASMEYPVTVSIGVAAYPENAQDMHELIRAADTAMYQAKESGKNQSCVFCPSTQLMKESG